MHGTNTQNTFNVVDPCMLPGYLPDNEAALWGSPTILEGERERHAVLSETQVDNACLGLVHIHSPQLKGC